MAAQRPVEPLALVSDMALVHELVSRGLGNGGSTSPGPAMPASPAASGGEPGGGNELMAMQPLPPHLRVGAFSLLVPDYDSAIAFFVGVCGFELTEDRDEGRKRWVTVRPRGAETQVVLARADTDH